MPSDLTKKLTELDHLHQRLVELKNKSDKLDEEQINKRLNKIERDYNKLMMEWFALFKLKPIYLIFTYILTHVFKPIST